MTSRKVLSRFLSGLLTISLAAGCAPAYHSYPGGCVECQYFPPPPLPYSLYAEGACHSSAAWPYLQFDTVVTGQGGSGELEVRAE